MWQQPGAASCNSPCLTVNTGAGPARTVEFDFDMGADTAMSVASEMVEDLSLSHNDAIAIAAAIKQEIKQLTGQAPMFSVVER